MKTYGYKPVTMGHIVEGRFDAEIDQTIVNDISSVDLQTFVVDGEPVANVTSTML